MRAFTRIADRLLGRVAPKATAAADVCWYEDCPTGAGARICCERTGCSKYCV